MPLASWTRGNPPASRWSASNAAHNARMPASRVAELIYLSGVRGTGYTVHCNGFDGMVDLSVPSTRVGNAIVRTLRAEAIASPDLFPVSRWQAGRGTK